MRTVLRMWGLARPYWKRLTIAYISLLAGMALDLTLPRVLQNVIDIGIAGSRPRYMATAGLIVLGIAVANVAMTAPAVPSPSRTTSPAAGKPESASKTDFVTCPCHVPFGRIGSSLQRTNAPLARQWPCPRWVLTM